MAEKTTVSKKKNLSCALKKFKTRNNMNETVTSEEDKTELNIYWEMYAKLDTRILALNISQ